MLCYSRDGLLVAVPGSDEKGETFCLDIRSLPSGALLESMKIGSRRPLDAAFSADARFIACSVVDESSRPFTFSVRRYSLEEGASSVWSVPFEDPLTLACSPDRDVLYGVGSGRLYFWPFR